MPECPIHRGPSFAAPRFPPVARRLLPLLLLLAWLASGTGCKSVMPTDLRPYHEPVPPLALPYRTSVDVTIPLAASSVATLDTTLVHDALRRAGTFASPGASNGPGAEATDLALHVELGTPEYAFVRKNERARRAFWIWVYAGPPAMWIRDETYAGEVGWTAVLSSRRTRREVLRIEGRSRVQGDLDDFERGFVLLGPIRVPGALDEENFRVVGRNLGSELARCVARDVAETVDRAVREAALDPRFAFKVTGRRGAVAHAAQKPPAASAAPPKPGRRGYAIIAAANPTGDLARRARFSEADALALRDWLTGPDGPRYSERNVLYEVGPLSSTRRVADFVEKRLPALSAHAEEVVVFLSGLGAVGPVRGGGHARYLLLGDSDVSDVGRTGLSLDRILAVLAKAGTPRVLVVMDAGFGAGSRSVPWAPTTTDVEERSLATFAAKPGRILLLGAAPGRNASESSALGHGLLTHALLDALRGLADANGDGEVNGGELEAFVDGRVRAGSRGLQRPVLIGDPGASVAGLPLPPSPMDPEAQADDAPADEGREEGTFVPPDQGVVAPDGETPMPEDMDPGAPREEETE